ncbi:MAG: asparagine synthetase B [Nevskiales bacterium]
MCGIAGFLNADRLAPVDSAVLGRMTDVVRHRGPDGEGQFIDGPVGLGHRRLAIIDPATGHQPMTDPVTGNVIVFNGEIYNYLELRAELEAAGDSFQTRSDTEVILKAYARWGAQCLARFNGMWAFALWDARERRLFLARDRLGIKPLHWCLHGDRFLFASEMKSLFAAGVPRVADRSLLDVYLTLGYIPAPHSWFAGVRKLEPGHCIVTDGRAVTVSRWWDLPAVDEGAMRRDAATVDAEFEELLRDAVRISMRSDVPFGAFLSGGLDSSSIVTLMAGETSLPVETFTIGFDDPAFDERGLARQVAAAVGARHHERTVTPEDLDGAIARVARHYDEPFGDSSALPTSHVAQLAVSRVKMVLTGDGGDEVLSGYRAYQVEKVAGLWQRVPAPLRKLPVAVLAAAAGVARGSTRYRVDQWLRLLRTTAAPFEERLLTKAAWLEKSRREALLAADRVQPVEDIVDALMQACPYRDPFYRLMYFNHKVSLPDDMLTKVDRMTMAWSLEARVPLLDFRLVELMAGVDKAVKLDGLTRKAVLRRTVGRRLPRELLSAGKRGFVVPLRSWFAQSGFADDRIRRAAALAGLPAAGVQELLDEQRTGRRDYGNLLWMLMVLGAVAA